jgi:hypothetical protein
MRLIGFQDGGSRRRQNGGLALTMPGWIAAECMEEYDRSAAVHDSR